MPARSTAARDTATAIEQRVVTLDHPVLESVDVRVRRNRRSRHVRLHVDEHGVITASVPARFAARRIDPIVRERADWLHDVLVRMEQKAHDTAVDLERGDPVRWLGRWLPTQVQRGGRRASGAIEHERLVLRVPDDGDAHEALLAWYRREARAIFERRVAVWSELFGLTPGKVSVREQRTRWGSCTYRGDLSFNWRLVLAPDWVLDSIVVHELCHIDELNHSDRFWALLDRRYPRHEEASAWLKEHGAGLRVTRPAPRVLTADEEQAPTSHAPTAPRSAGGDAEQFSLFV